ncbi:MAG: 3-isopropylmalate dehydratase small subunit [Nitrososphaeria archaeon]|jgi:3-isopropylmalate/(R)-2-methylmalate dehydratase small subunit|nr:3-isopropylmalate dehydratase small subunit [Nitrososphaerota archaeon]
MAEAGGASLRFRGRVHKLGDNVDTDQIIPAPYLKDLSPENLAAHVLEGADPSFPRRIRPGDIVLGGRNFGSGSSREHAPMALRYAGVRVVMALSFARIFYRNAVDGGHLIPVIVTEEAYRGIGDGDEVEVDLESSIVRDLTAGAEYPVERFPRLIARIVQAGGIFSVGDLSSLEA